MGNKPGETQALCPLPWAHGLGVRERAQGPSLKDGQAQGAEQGAIPVQDERGGRTKHHVGPCLKSRGVGAAEGDGRWGWPSQRGCTWPGEPLTRDWVLGEEERRLEQPGR